MSTTAISHQQTTAIARSKTASAIASLFLGLAMIFVVGFAPMAEIHNAAHDTRHVSAFPCH